MKAIKGSSKIQMQNTPLMGVFPEFLNIRKARALGERLSCSRRIIVTYPMSALFLPPIKPQFRHSVPMIVRYLSIQHLSRLHCQNISTLVTIIYDQDRG